MAKIATYAIDAQPTINDKLIGTNVDDENITINRSDWNADPTVPAGSLIHIGLNPDNPLLACKSVCGLAFLRACGSFSLNLPSCSCG